MAGGKSRGFAGKLTDFRKSKILALSRPMAVCNNRFNSLTLQLTDSLIPKLIHCTSPQILLDKSAIQKYRQIHGAILSMRIFSRILVVLAAIAIIYFGSYFLIVKPGVAWADNGAWSASPKYRFDSITGSSVFSDLYHLAHNLDRHVFRPSLWEGTYDPVALMAADLGISRTGAKD